MNKDIEFMLKVLRNGFILAGLYFASVYATGNLTYEILKPVIVFFLGYIFAELAKHYGLQPSKIKSRKGTATLIFV